MGVCGEPHESSEEGLVRFAALEEDLVILVDGCRWFNIDGAYRLVRSCERVGVDLYKAVTLDDVLCVVFL